jgi:hypothetical protein
MTNIAVSLQCGNLGMSSFHVSLSYFSVCYLFSMCHYISYPEILQADPHCSYKASIRASPSAAASRFFLLYSSKVIMLCMYCFIHTLLQAFIISTCYKTRALININRMLILFDVSCYML